MSEQTFNLSKRNALLVKTISATDLGIHLLNMKHFPILITHDWKYEIGVYVKDYDIVVLKGENDVHYSMSLLNAKMEDIEELRRSLIDCINYYGQVKPIWILKRKDLLLTGFNHHNKVDKKNPYPVFAHYDPIVYHSREQAENTARKYNLEILNDENSDSIFNHNSI